MSVDASDKGYKITSLECDFGKDGPSSLVRKQL